MNTNIDTFSVTDLRHKTNQVLKNAREKGVAFLLRHSRTEAALVNINYLKALEEAYEDYLDTLEFDATVNLKRIPFSSHKKAKK